jgi:hypothetical protein
MSRDTDGPDGWASRCNVVLRRLASEGLIRLTAEKESGAEVSNSYWIDLPSDYHSGLTVYDPQFDGTEPERGITHSIINGKIKLTREYSTDDDPDTFTLSAGSTTAVTIDDDDAEEDEYEGKLLVVSDGAAAGLTFVLGEHDAASGGFTTLNLLHSSATSLADATSGYIVSDFLMLRYMAKATTLTTADDVLPVADQCFNALAAGLRFMTASPDSKERNTLRQEYEYEVDLLSNEVLSPDEEQARPQARPMAGLENCSNLYSSGFVGDEDAWLE